MKTLYIMCGPPGSGKTWFATNTILNPKTAYIPRDEIRFNLVKEDEFYFSQERKVFKQFIQLIQSALANESFRSVIADATHINMFSRKKLLNALNLSPYKNKRAIRIIPIWICPPLKICLAQNNLREGRARVPEKIITDIYNSCSHPKFDDIEYDFIIEVHNDLFY